MATITGHKSTLTGGTWKDDYEYESGPTSFLESSDLDRIMQVLPNLWNKGWQWPLLKLHTMYSPFIRVATFSLKKEKNDD